MFFSWPDLLYALCVIALCVIALCVIALCVIALCVIACTNQWCCAMLHGRTLFCVKKKSASLQSKL